ncbi:kynurenine 3-monooxygenase, mitochondrial precursor [Zygosaccharomyces mellis]|uniref:Kynurenine 3-monooxygenase n=1 Tax=Zygosaccharomyces mellis TaxID=42258 RepID=A0A4C2E9M7_9SACH|nr:kynurenine 3-monooxygenase, mitochondrial precursor [Zygosaccharomyces mellis]
MGEQVIIVGAGLVGCLAALAFHKRGYEVNVYDYRFDPRDESTQDKNLRSINLAISARGIESLKFVDEHIAQRVLRDVIPMKGRMIHDLRGEQESQVYGLFGECINSIDRAVLNNFLLDELDRYGIDIHFGYKLVRAKFNDKRQTCIFSKMGQDGVTETVECDFVVGCDGAFSSTRYQMQRAVRMDYSQEYIDCCYIELYIPRTKQYIKKFNGNFAIAPDHLHIWPRHNFMLIALANGDGSFTSTFFGPWSLVESLTKSRDKTRKFLLQNFPDAMALMGIDDAVHKFITYPKGALMCVECNPYHINGGKAIILGDAAHSMVPFYGQGMNCGFEDVRVLMKLLDQSMGDRSVAFKRYSETRHKDLAAIIELAKNNYKEMSHDVTSTVFLIKKQLDSVLGRILKNKWLPLYTMVSFRADVPYHRAVEISNRQKVILNQLLRTMVATSTLLTVLGLSRFGTWTKKWFQ